MCAETVTVLQPPKLLPELQENNRIYSSHKLLSQGLYICPNIRELGNSGCLVYTSAEREARAPRLHELTAVLVVTTNPALCLDRNPPPVVQNNSHLW